MFTGIVEELGRVVAVTPTGPQAARLTVRGPLVTTDAVDGGSIAVSGVCLTVVDLDPAAGAFTADVMAETLHRTSLGARRPGDPVNLERALRADGRLDGHLVQGHVDGVGRVVRRTPGERWEVLRIALPADLARYVVQQGSIAVDGVSLTVSGLDDGWFEVSLIPATLARTTLGTVAAGDPVNLEVDVLAKHLERLLDARSHTSDTTAPGSSPW